MINNNSNNSFEEQNINNPFVCITIETIVRKCFTLLDNVKYYNEINLIMYNLSMGL